jgi:hypothetical protein
VQHCQLFVDTRKKLFSQRRYEHEKQAKKLKSLQVYFFNNMSEPQMPMQPLNQKVWKTN